MRMRCVGALIGGGGLGAIAGVGMGGVRSAFVLDYKRALNSQQSSEFGRYFVRVHKR